MIGRPSDPTGAPLEQYKFYRCVRENLLSMTEEKALDQAAIAFMGAFSRGACPTIRSSARCASSPKR
ncbi:MAG: hypothetical protein DME04_06030 [Candidatus Rokuibacteriota bacterium]|nr:MAG: hypothetical protein DME04_06030 [Candidatus Rokubacteria bacterium]